MVVSLDVAYYIECKDCGKQFSEQEYAAMHDWIGDLRKQQAIYDNALEAEATGN